MANDEHAEALFESALKPGRPAIRSCGRGRSCRTAAGSAGSAAAPTSRVPLRGAVESFDVLGAASWGRRARQELRATGERLGPRTEELRDRLTAQELQIAELAAQGLSNREIGERMFLSHRTIGSHLYRCFPKLEITSRSQLRDALADRRQ